MRMKAQPIRTYVTQQKAVLRGKFITMNAYIENTGRSQINDLTLHLKLLEKQEQSKPKETKNWFFEKIMRLTNPWQI
jgi:hypothetical protein